MSREAYLDWHAPKRRMQSMRPRGDESEGGRKVVGKLLGVRCMALLRGLGTIVSRH